MKLRITVGLMLLAMLVILAGCSPTIGRWSDRGVVGIENARYNVKQFEANIQKYIAERRKANINIAFNDIALCRDGKIVRPDGTVVEFNDKWLEDHKAGLLLLMGLLRKEEDKLDAEIKTAMSNLDHLEICFDKIKRLNKVYVGSKQELADQVELLSQIVDKLIKKED